MIQTPAENKSSSLIIFLLLLVPSAFSVFRQLLPCRTDPGADQLSDSGHQHQQRGADGGQPTLRRASHPGGDHAIPQHGEAAAQLPEHHHRQVESRRLRLVLSYVCTHPKAASPLAGGLKRFSVPSCLRAIRELQKNGHIPSDASLFKSYAEYGHFVDVRVAALEALVDYTRGTASTPRCHRG